MALRYSFRVTYLITFDSASESSLNKNLFLLYRSYWMKKTKYVNVKNEEKYQKKI